MLDKAKGLLQPSARSAVPPFMVMDVMAAAARLEAQGRRIIHMEVGQPAAGAPSTAIAARAAALSSGAARLHRNARHSLAAAAHRARLSRMARPRHRPAAHRGHDRLLGRIYPRVSRRLRGRRSRRRGAAGLSALSPHPFRARLRAGRDRDGAQTRWSITGETLLREHRARPLKGVVVASPANPTGTMMTRRRSPI